jgi:hypothetical protein
MVVVTVIVPVRNKSIRNIKDQISKSAERSKNNMQEKKNKVKKVIST